VHVDRRACVLLLLAHNSLPRVSCCCCCCCCCCCVLTSQACGGGAASSGGAACAAQLPHPHGSGVQVSTCWWIQSSCHRQLLHLHVNSCSTCGQVLGAFGQQQGAVVLGLLVCILRAGSDVKLIPSTPPTIRVCLARLFVLGGRTPAGVAEGPDFLACFDTSDGRWRPSVPAAGRPPCARSSHRAIAYREHLLVCAGVTAEDGPGRLADVWVLLGAGGGQEEGGRMRWQQLAVPPGFTGEGGVFLSLCVMLPPNAHTPTHEVCTITCLPHGAAQDAKVVCPGTRNHTNLVPEPLTPTLTLTP
jgi:hypothetical protein